MSRQIQRRLKKVCNTKYCQTWIANHHHQKRRNILRQLFSSPSDKLCHHRHKFIDVQSLLPSVILISSTYNQRSEFYVPQYLLICLCSNTDLYSTLINLSKLTSEPKTRKIGYRDAIYCYVPETTFHKPSFVLNVDYP